MPKVCVLKDLVGFLVLRGHKRPFCSVGVCFGVKKARNDLRRSMCRSVLGELLGDPAWLGSLGTSSWKRVQPAVPSGERVHGGPGRRTTRRGRAGGCREVPDPRGKDRGPCGRTRSPARDSPVLEPPQRSFRKGPSLAAVTSGVKGWSFSAATMFLSSLFKSRNSGAEAGGRWDGARASPGCWDQHLCARPPVPAVPSRSSPRRKPESSES